MIEKYADDGELQFTLPDVLKIPPISQRGNVNGIIGKFGDALRNALEIASFTESFKGYKFEKDKPRVTRGGDAEYRFL